MCCNFDYVSHAVYSWHYGYGQYPLGQGINREDFYFKTAISSTFKKFSKGVFRPHRQLLYLLTANVSHGKCNKSKIRILSWLRSKCVPIDLKGASKSFKGEIEWFWIAYKSKMCENYPNSCKYSILGLKWACGVYKSCAIPVFVSKYFKSIIIIK